jgi:SAM-dependent methyltransferase
VDSSRRERESGYWDSQARMILGEDFQSISDNVHKRPQVIGNLLNACDWVGQKVLEIGVGVGMTASAMRVALMGQWDYLGTDMSQRFVLHAKEHWGLEVVRTDILNLPDGPFTRVMALDTLEHVNPADRDGGYKEIARVTASGGLLLINMPLDEAQHSHHDSEFDHPFALADLDRIEQQGFQLKSYQRYYTTGSQPRPIAFVVMERR